VAACVAGAGEGERLVLLDLQAYRSLGSRCATRSYSAS
jgi:hypothetical protein